MDNIKWLQQKSELTAAEYWEAQSSMWYQNYKDAEHQLDILKEALTELATSTYHSVDDYKNRAREALGDLNG